MERKLEEFAMNENNPKWVNAIKREEKLYNRGNDLRSEFERDYTRIIYSNGYRRLRNKTQVFFSPSNDHVCTRMEHTTCVAAISYTIGKTLGLNLELIQAIATAHDIGHTPFGHAGERILNKISVEELDENFWHEKNGLYFADRIELLEDDKGFKNNLNLTYAVRDGIISHCGEVDENNLKPREEYINLNDYIKPNQYMPYTWEGCVIKLADKISYIGRDIEDAIDMGLLESDDLEELNELITKKFKKTINNSNIINVLINDLCLNSNEEGLRFSKEIVEIMNEIKRYNYKKIYQSERLRNSDKYFNIIINTVFSTLKNGYKQKDTISNLKDLSKKSQLFLNFLEWIRKYYIYEKREDEGLSNIAIYNLENEGSYTKAVIDYISGMTDNCAIKAYKDIISFDDFYKK